MARTTMRRVTPAAVTGPFVATAAAKQIRPPLRLLGEDARGWHVGDRGRDSLVLDEYGDLWWARLVGRGEARPFRRCWPEEFTAMRDVIEQRLRELTA